MDPESETVLEGASAGCNTGFTNSNGEWVEYTVNVAEDGLYDISFQYSTEFTDKQLMLTVDGDTIADSIYCTSSGGRFTFADARVPQVSLEAGIQTWRTTWIKGGVNIDYIDVARADASARPRTAGTFRTAATYYPQAGLVRFTNTPSLEKILLSDLRGRRIGVFEGDALRNQRISVKSLPSGAYIFAFLHRKGHREILKATKSR